MRVRVDPDVCAGFGICINISPDVFVLHEDGYAIVMIDDLPPDMRDLVQRAADQCPSRAISIVGD